MNALIRENIKTLMPTIVSNYWCYEMNNVLPEDVSIFSNEKYYWKNLNGIIFHLQPLDLYKPLPSTSRMEQTIYYYIKKIFPRTALRYRIKNIKTEADVFVPEINLAIEYDGIYFHKKKADKDMGKNQFMNSCGIYIIRVRDEGLPNLEDFYGEIIIHRKNNELITLIKIINAIQDFIFKNNIVIEKDILSRLINFSIDESVLEQDFWEIRDNYYLIRTNDNLYHKEIILNFYNEFNSEILMNDEIFQKFKKLAIFTRGFPLFEYIRDENLAKRYYDEEMDGWSFNKVIDITAIDDLTYLENKINSFIKSDYYFWFGNILKKFISHMENEKKFNSINIKKFDLLMNMTTKFVSTYPDFYLNWEIQDLEKLLQNTKGNYIELK